MPQPSNAHYLFDFNQLNENGLKPLVKAIGAGGFEIAKVIPAGTSRKKDGIATKTFSLVAVDEQIMQIQVNDSGDISGVKLNGKNAPFQHSDNLNLVGSALAKLFSGAATAFEKALAKKLAKGSKADGSGADRTAKTTVKSNAQVMTEAKSRRDSAKEDIEKTTQAITDAQSQSDAKATEVSNLSQELAKEQALTKQLKEQIAQAQEG